MTMTTVTKPVQKKRVSLANLRKGKLREPVRAIIYGTEGVGKSTFASCAPNPIFICAESGTHHLDVDRFTLPEDLCWQDVLDAVDVLITDKEHIYQTLVIDTLDWLEPIVWDNVIANGTDGKGGKPKSIEDVGGGYGKGYQAAVEQWRVLISKLERLQTTRRMHVVLVAHAHIKVFSNPEGENFDRYEMKMNQKAAGKFKEWVDDVLFATYDESFVLRKGEKKAKGTDAKGARIIRTERRAAFDAKTRHSLPFRIPMNWDEYFEARGAGRSEELDRMIADARGLAATLGLEERVEQAIKKVGNDAVKMLQVLDWLQVKLRDQQEREQQEEQEQEQVQEQVQEQEQVSEETQEQQAEEAAAA